uniref:TIR domain-containing protein n=1 Tax=Leptobrachium leishanense TaxID=445787 RepID=A0A8C5MZ28_9ANUR
MGSSRFLPLWLLCLSSTYLSCLCAVRRPCLVMERQYFETYGHLVFYDCSEFFQVNFTIAAYCRIDTYNQNSFLEDVPLDADWLCLNYRTDHTTVKAEIFSHLTSLKSLYVHGFFRLAPESFGSLPQLTTLWIYPENYSIDGKLDFGNLNSLQELYINNIYYSDMNVSTFANLNQLKQFVLANNKINSFSSVTKHLAQMKNLLNLTINNPIGELREEDCLSDELSGNRTVHFGVHFLNLGLQEIYHLENNSLCNFPKLSFFSANFRPNMVENIFYSGVKTADTMSFQYIQFDVMEICVYASRFKVKELQLMKTEMQYLETTIDSCATLKILDISFNNMEEVSSSQIENLKNLTTINMSNNRIKALAVCPFKKSTSMEMELLYLNVSFNLILELREGHFACLKKLQVLDLSDNHIAYITNCTFCGLEKLEVLHLENNHIYAIDEYSFSGLLSLKQLNLHDNQLAEINDWAFYDLKELEEIDLTFINDLEQVWWCKYIASSLRKMSLKTNTENMFLSYEQFTLFSRLESLVIDANYVFIDFCDYFPFYTITELYLSNNVIITCLDNPVAVLGNFINLKKLYYNAYYSGASIVTLNSSLLSLNQLEYLCLDNTEKLVDNSLVNLYVLFQGLVNLKVLHLINSGVGHLNSDVMFQDLKSVTALLIENQNIEEINEEVFSPMRDLKYVYLHDTSIECKCQLSWLSQWILSNKQVSFIDFYDQNCVVTTQSSTMILVTLLENCDAEFHFTMFIVSFLMTLVFMLVSLFYESIWWYTLYLFYTIKCCLNHRLRGEQVDQYEFDVFVSYNTVDEQWVTEELLHNLEHTGPPFFKVCIHNRDFEIGRDIVENIVDSIYKSRWTVCVITRSYLQSHWCSLEMRMATYRLIAENKDSLLLIFLDKISKEEIQCYHRLTKLLDKKTYLEWPDERNGQELFWARLRKVIGGHIERNYEEL